MVCVSILPIDDSTLVYGSSNAGRKMHKSNPEFNALMKIVGKRLNLRPHIAGFGPPTKMYVAYFVCFFPSTCGFKYLTLLLLNVDMAPAT